MKTKLESVNIVIKLYNNDKWLGKFYISEVIFLFSVFHSFACFKTKLNDNFSKFMWIRFSLQR